MTGSRHSSIFSSLDIDRNIALDLAMNRQRSQQLFTEAKRVIPGGVNSPVRAFRGVGGDPVFFARGQGPYLYDADGNEYVDYVGSWGPLLLGHAHPEVLAAIEEAARSGTSFG